MDEETNRYWVDDTPEDKPFGESTRAIVDEDAGGVILYTHKSFVSEILKALEKE